MISNPIKNFGFARCLVLFSTDIGRPDNQSNPRKRPKSGTYANAYLQAQARYFRDADFFYAVLSYSAK